MKQGTKVADFSRRWVYCLSDKIFREGAFVRLSSSTPAMPTWRRTCSPSAGVEDAATCDSVTEHNESDLEYKIDIFIFFHFRKSNIGFVIRDPETTE